MTESGEQGPRQRSVSHASPRLHEGVQNRTTTKQIRWELLIRAFLQGYPEDALRTD
jgi:hypothetical protein